MRTIRNIPHDLLPVIQDMTEKLALLRNVKSISDHIQLVDALKNNTFLVEEYLLSLEEEAKNNGIEKS